MKSVLVLLAVCTLSAAMVPRAKRALNFEELMRTSAASTTTTGHSTTVQTTEICAPQTPCAWTTYRPATKIIDIRITNTYCVCGAGLDCIETDDDTSVSAFIHRCRPPTEAEDSAAPTES